MWNDKAIDPDGVEVWCDYADREAMTNKGFCQYCGSTEHKPLADQTEAPCDPEWCVVHGTKRS